MTIARVSFQKTFSLGNYENEKIGVDVQLEPGEDPSKALTEARNYVEHAHQFTKEFPKYERLKEILKDPKNATGYQVEEAKRKVAQFEQQFEKFLTLDGQSRLPVPAEQTDDEYGKHNDDQY